MLSIDLTVMNDFIYPTSPWYVANDVGVSHTVTLTTGSRSGVIENQSRDRSTVGLLSTMNIGLAQLLEWLHQRIVVTENHLVVQLAIDPALDDRLMSLKSHTMLRLSSVPVRTSISAVALWPCGCLQIPS